MRKDQSRAFLSIPSFYDLQAAHLVKEMGEHLQSQFNVFQSVPFLVNEPSY